MMNKCAYNFQNFDDENENSNYIQNNTDLTNKSNNNNYTNQHFPKMKTIEENNMENNQMLDVNLVYSQNQDMYNTVSSASSAQKMQEEYLQKVKKMENLIGIIKDNGYNKFREELETKLQIKNELENRVEILASYIRINRLQQKNFGIGTKSFDKENDRLISSSLRCQDEDYFLSQSLVILKNEINKLQKEICQNKEEVKYYRNEKLQIERETMDLEDDIKKYNFLNSNIYQEKEGIKNSIKLIKSHSIAAKSKIDKQNELTDEFLKDLTLLAIDTQKQSEEYDKRNFKYNKSSRISTADSLKKGNKKKEEIE